MRPIGVNYRGFFRRAYRAFDKYDPIDFWVYLPWGILVALLAFVLGFLFDVGFSETIFYEGIVTEKTFDPSGPRDCDGCFSPDDDFKLLFQNEDGYAVLHCDYETYIQIEVGEEVAVKAEFGGITGHRYDVKIIKQ